MNGYLLTAAVLLSIVGLVHSVLGEILIFRRMRDAGIIPANGGDILHESNVRILWASWHLISIFGWGVAAILVFVSLAPLMQGEHYRIAVTIAIVTFVSAILVCVATKGKHPGWIGLLGVAVLTALGCYT